MKNKEIIRNIMLHIADMQLSLAPDVYSGTEREKREYAYGILSDLFHEIENMDEAERMDSLREKIRYEENFKARKRSVLEVLREELPDASEEDLDGMAEVAAERLEVILDKSDPYWDAYWECLNMAVQEVIAEEE